MIKKPIEVTLLPTEDKTNVGYYTDSKDRSLYFHVQGCDKRKGFEPHYVYVTVSPYVEHIKANEWFIFKDKVYKCNSISEDLVFFYNEKQDEIERYINDCKKIIATTDPKLTIECKKGTCTRGCSEHYHKCMEAKPIPQVSQSFLKEFVDNPNGKYVVDYEYQYHSSKELYGKEADWVTCNKSRFEFIKETLPTCPLRLKLKLNQDNEVIITSVEEKMIPMSKVLKLVEESNHFSYLQGVKIGKGEEVNGTFSIEDWIKENL